MMNMMINSILIGKDFRMILIKFFVNDLMTLIQRWKHPEPTLQIFLLRILTPFAGLLDELICIFSFTLLISSFKYQTIYKRTELTFKHKEKQWEKNK